MMTGRRQAVQIKEAVSELVSMEIGTPQGSRLSPLLFVILMADLDLWTKDSKLSNFADDTQSIIIQDTRERLIETVQQEAKTVTKFSVELGLSIMLIKQHFYTTVEEKEKQSQ